MHARAAFYQVTPDSLDASLEKVRQELLPLMREQPGLKRYTVVVSGPESFVSLSGWDTREQSEQAAETLSGWVREHIGPTVVSMESHIGEVVLLHGQSSPDRTPAFGVVLQHTPKPGAPDLTEKIRADFLPIFDSQPGFNVFVRIRADDGRFITFAGWDSREALGRAQPTLSKWGDENVTPHMSSASSAAGPVAWTVRNS